MFRNMMDTIGFVAQTDPEVAAAMDRELARQRRNLELIASENIVSPAVLAAMGTVLTNKYAEGYPGKRYYGGCVNVDEVEDLARERAKRLFGAQHANVQPHEPGRGRAPDPRQPGEYVRQAVQLCPLRRFPGDRPHRLRRPPGPGQGSEAQDDRGRGLCLSPGDRF